MALWWLAAGCDGEGTDSAPARFYVAEVTPADGAITDTELTTVILRFSAAPSLDRCTATTIRVDGLRADGTVAFPVPAELELTGAATLRVRPIDPYPHGYAYAVTVRGGATGCADADGIAVEPFFSTFQVP